MKSIFSEKVAGAETWGAGYYAEGARGSRGPNPEDLGDRSKVELSLAKSFALLRGDTAAAAVLGGLEQVIGRGGKTSKYTRRNLEELDVD